MSDLRGYVLCASPRSGSSYLCSLLRGTGVLGEPREYFNGVGRRRVDDPDYPDDPIQQCAKILTMGATDNGVYGFKVFAHQTDRVAHTRWPTTLPDLRWIYLERTDIIGQAISWARALQTDQWRAVQAPAATPVYRSEQLNGCVSSVMVERVRWNLFFAVNEIEPLRLTYETVVEDPSKAVLDIADIMDVELFKPIEVDPAMIIQRDHINDEWRSRYLQEMASPDQLPLLS